MLKGDPLANVLYVDLTRRQYSVERREDLFRENLGGSGVTIRFLEEECPKGTEPLSPENPIIFAVGPLTALFPLASKTVAMFKSPHTGNLGESHAGGRSAIAIRLAGYGAIVIKGASHSPIYLAIHGNEVFFRDASSLWGMGSCFTVGRIIRENEPGAGVRTIMRIGKAGERRISYASVTTETYRHFGRLGLGAVFGSKNLKAVVVSGSGKVPVKDPGEYRRLYNEIYDACTLSQAMRKYHDLGTSENVLPLNALSALPTRNLLASKLEKAENISGETMTRDYLGRRLACSHCPVGCIHTAALREPYQDEPFFYKTSMISYDYEPIYALGTLLGITEPSAFLKLMNRVEAYGLDAMSTGVVMAWATEAFQGGLISEKETQGVHFDWGNYQEYIKGVEKLVSGEGEFYQALGKGVGEASRIYGGEEFALNFAGNEMAGYHTGPGAHLGLLVGARHSHLDNAGYSIDQKFTPETLPSPEKLAEMILKEEEWRQVLSSLVLCFFARGIYNPEVVQRTLSCAGFELSEGDLHQLGRTIHREKYRFKEREGFSLERLSLPQRVYQTPTPLGEIKEGYVREFLMHFSLKVKEGS